MSADNTPDNAPETLAAPNPDCFCRGAGGGRYADYRNGRGGRTTLCDHQPLRYPA